MTFENGSVILINYIRTPKNHLRFWEWYIPGDCDIALQQSLIPRVFTRVIYITVYSVHVSSYYMSPSTLEKLLLRIGQTYSSIFPLPVSNTHHINL
jgi:hypothetical protein